MKFICFYKNYNLLVSKLIFEEFNKKQNSNIILTGGTTVKNIYKLININNLKNKKNFYLSDERITLNKSKLNKYNIQKYLFKNTSCKSKLLDFETNSKIYDKIEKYSKNFPKKINIALLSLGNDGHLASIFNLKNKGLNKRYFYQQNKNLNRISMGKRVIKSTKNFFIFAKGSEKGKVLNKYLNASSINKKKYVLNLFKSSYILLDIKAYNEITNEKIKKSVDIRTSFCRTRTKNT